MNIILFNFYKRDLRSHNFRQKLHIHDFFLFSYILTTYNGVVVQIIQTDKMRNEITYYKYPRLIHFSFLYNIQVDTCISYA